MAATGGAGVLIEAVAYRRLRSAPRLAVLITAVGMSFVLEYGARQVWGPNPKPWPAWARLGGGRIDWGSATISSAQLLLMLVAVGLMAALAAYVGLTRRGRAMRAIALDQRAAALVGIDVNRTISLVFFIGSALAGAAGVMFGAYYASIDFMMGFLLGLKAFTAAVIGGIGNLYGAMLGGITLGLLEALGTAWLGAEWKDVFAVAGLILFVSLKPTGLLGGRVTERM
jgi:branched-chain amino acid transport system permease protein